MLLLLADSVLREQTEETLANNLPVEIAGVEQTVLRNKNNKQFKKNADSEAEAVCNKVVLLSKLLE